LKPWLEHERLVFGVRVEARLHGGRLGVDVREAGLHPVDDAFDELRISVLRRIGVGLVPHVVRACLQPVYGVVQRVHRVSTSRLV
jgi:hypothetical protein